MEDYWLDEIVEKACELAYDSGGAAGVIRNGFFGVSRDEFKWALRHYIETGENALKELDYHFWITAARGFKAEIQECNGDKRKINRIHTPFICDEETLKMGGKFCKGEGFFKTRTEISESLLEDLKALYEFERLRNEKHTKKEAKKRAKDQRSGVC